MYYIGRTYAQAATRRREKPGLPFNPENPFDTLIPRLPIQVQGQNTSQTVEDLDIEQISDSETIVVDTSSQYTQSILDDDVITIHSGSTRTSNMPSTRAAYASAMLPPSNEVNGQLQARKRHRHQTNTLDTNAELEAASQRIKELETRIRLAQEQKARELHDKEAQLRQILLDLEG